MAKQEISVDAVYLLFEEIRTEISKLGKSSNNSSQTDVTVDLSSVERELEGVQEQLAKLINKVADNTSLAELQDIKKKINNIPQPARGITESETKYLLNTLQEELTRTIHTSVKRTRIVTNKLSTKKFYSIFISFLILVGIAGYYAIRYHQCKEVYYEMKRKKEFYEHYYVRYRYIQARDKTVTKSDIKWINEAPTDSIANLLLELEKKKNLKDKKK